MTNGLPMLLNGVSEAKATTLFFSFDEEDDVQTESASRKQRSSSTSDSENRTLVVSHTTAVEVSVFSCKDKRIRVPAIGWGGNNIVVTGRYVDAIVAKGVWECSPIEEYARFASFTNGTRECPQDKRAYTFASRKLGSE